MLTHLKKVTVKRLALSSFNRRRGGGHNVTRGYTYTAWEKMMSHGALAVSGQEEIAKRWDLRLVI